MWNVYCGAKMVAEMILPYLSLSAIASTFGVNLCGIPICYRIHQQGCSDTTSGAIFLTGFISCAFWWQYGLIMEDNVIVMSSGTGFLLQTAYLGYYYSMLNNRIVIRRIIIFELFLIVSMVSCLHYFRNTEPIIDVLITFCILLNIVSIGAPLASIGEVIRTKSTDSMPFLLCLANFFVSAQWLLYGIIVGDFVIQVPNYINTTISAIQLILFFIYPRTSPPVVKKNPLPCNSYNYNICTV